MLKELKQQLDQQYEDMWRTDWVEVIGSVIAVALMGLFGYLWFSLVNL